MRLPRKAAVRISSVKYAGAGQFAWALAHRLTHPTAARNGSPKAVLGLLDVSARPMVDKDLLSFTVPFEMFLNMEKNVPDSFLRHHKSWLKVKERI